VCFHFLTNGSIIFRFVWVTIVLVILPITQLSGIIPQSNIRLNSFSYIFMNWWVVDLMYSLIIPFSPDAGEDDLDFNIDSNFMNNLNENINLYISREIFDCIKKL
jgi:hypothetical protein